MTKDEILKLALEALEKYAHDFGSSDLSVKAMYVVRQALAQPEHEPVAFGTWYKNAIWGNEDFKTGCERAWNAAVKHTTPPPQRTWDGLTEDEIKECFQITPDQYLPAQIYKRIEAKLKEKNA